MGAGPAGGPAGCSRQRADDPGSPLGQPSQTDGSEKLGRVGGLLAPGNFHIYIQ